MNGCCRIALVWGFRVWTGCLPCRQPSLRIDAPTGHAPGRASDAHGTASTAATASRGSVLGANAPPLPGVVVVVGDSALADLELRDPRGSDDSDLPLVEAAEVTPRTAARGVETLLASFELGNAPAVRQGLSTKTALPSLRVVFVDDEGPNRRIGKRLLERLGITSVVLLENGASLPSSCADHLTLAVAVQCWRCVCVAQEPVHWSTLLQTRQTSCSWTS